MVTNSRIKGSSQRVPRAGCCRFTYKMTNPPVRHSRLKIAKLIPKRLLPEEQVEQPAQSNYRNPEQIRIACSSVFS